MSARKRPTRLRGRDGFQLAVLWLVLGTVLAGFAVYARDYIDVDAGRYEHLAISIATLHTLVPRVNGVDIHSYSQLYPILIAPFFVHGAMTNDLENSRIASALIMSSACIPAFLLTRRVTLLRWAPLAVGFLTVCMPWIVTSMFLMTEVAAYPACTWAVLALVVAISKPSKRHDILALLAIALAFLARGELILLVIVLPLALAAFELGRAAGDGLVARLAATGRTLIRGHVILAVVYAVAGITALVLYLESRLSSILGIYSAYSSSAHLAWARLPRSIVEHLATFSLGVGVVPFVIALAWIGANAIRPPASRNAHAFACVAAFMLIVLFVQATNFDLVVNAYVHDRFLIYFVPVVLVGVVLAVADERRPRLSLVAPLALVVAGFALGAIPSVTWGRFPWLDLDTPISTVYRILALHLGGINAARAELIAFAIAGTTLFLAGVYRLSPRTLRLAVFAFCAVAMSLATAAVFFRNFEDQDRNGRPVTQSQHGLADWIDGVVGTERPGNRDRLSGLERLVREREPVDRLRVLQQVDRPRRTDRQRGSVRLPRILVPEARSPLRPGDGSGRRIADTVGRREHEGDTLPHRGHCEGLRRRRSPHRRRQALAPSVAHLRALRRRLDEAVGADADAPLSAARTAAARAARGLDHPPLGRGVARVRAANGAPVGRRRRDAGLGQLQVDPGLRPPRTDTRSSASTSRARRRSRATSRPTTSPSCRGAAGSSSRR